MASRRAVVAGLLRERRRVVSMLMVPYAVVLVAKSVGRGVVDV